MDYLADLVDESRWVGDSTAARQRAYRSKICATWSSDFAVEGIPKPVVEEADLPPRLAWAETNLRRSRAMSSERRAAVLVLGSMGAFRVW
jgi:hypothetical protein